MVLDERAFQKFANAWLKRDDCRQEKATCPGHRRRSDAIWFLSWPTLLSIEIWQH
ncbi:unnamed protein product [Callosobruchus maculatus]|uniref:Uncharacterized protein n=1 Tax=Callosobruchus maculatus TaxID=64391 RepID=A0A653CVK2_CALMS|nr:unnamed protein product [Callosobruchus maculatus]